MLRRIADTGFWVVENRVSCGSLHLRHRRMIAVCTLQKPAFHATTQHQVGKVVKLNLMAFGTGTNAIKL
jgi:hypothetical protein